LYSFDIPTNAAKTANILPFGLSANGSLSLICGNATAILGQLALIQDKFLYAFDATSATIAAFTIAHGKSGALTPVGNSPFPVPDTFKINPQFARIEADPLGRFIFITDFQNGLIFVFLADKTTGALTLASGSPISVASPIHLAVHPSGNFVYVGDSQGALIHIYTIDANGNMVATGSPFIIPSGPFGGDAPLFLALHSNGKFLFTANRTSVSSYDIDPSTGNLSFAPGAPYDVSALNVAPLRLALEATGKYLYVSNTANTGIPAYAVDATTGALTAVPGPLAAQIGGLFDLVANPQGPELYVHIGNSINVYAIDLTTGVLTAPAGASKFFTASNMVIANVQ
jgi:6-phosphogluconolactonase (cycloisomerase 2 family)